LSAMRKLLPLLWLAACAETPQIADAGPGSLRVAHLGADLPAKLEICFVRPGENRGPLLPLLGAPYLEFAQVTRYFDVPPGSWGLRILDAGAHDCGVGVRPDLPVEISGGRATVAIAGLIAAASPFDLRAVVVPDDPPAASPGFRGINLAAPNPVVDVGIACGQDPFVGFPADYAAVPAYTTLAFSSCQPAARLPGESVDFARTVGVASLTTGQFGTAYVFGRKIIFCPDAPTPSPLAPCVQ
jgi:hypothetical protein